MLSQLCIFICIINLQFMLLKVQSQFLFSIQQKIICLNSISSKFYMIIFIANSSALDKTPKGMISILIIYLWRMEFLDWFRHISHFELRSQCQICNSCFIFLMIPSENVGEGIDEDYIPLLKAHRFDSVEHLNNVLFDYEHSQTYHRSTPKIEPPNEEQVKLAKNYSYKEICEVYANKQNLLDEAKKLLKLKYYKGDIIRALQYHKTMWLLCSRASFRIKENKQYYGIIKGCEYPEYFHKVVEADVRRTLQQKSQQNQEKLSNILRALAKRNPFIGYCQGMNFIINFLVIMRFQQEEIFWISCALFEEILPPNYYTNMLGVAIDLKLIEVFLRLRRPRLYAKLQSLSINLSIFSLQWLVCLFTTVLPFYILVVLWDLLFLQGSSILLKAIIVLIDELQPIILSCKDITQFLTQIQGFKKKAHMDESKFFDRLRSIYINRELLPFAREIYEKLMVGDTKNGGKKINTVYCNPEWPICYQLLQKNKIEQLDSDVWIFKEDGPPKMFENYLDSKLKGVKPFYEDGRDKMKRLIAGRTPHICNPRTYDLIKGKRAEIELSQYDSETNSFQLPVDSVLNDVSLKFLRSATIINSTFVFHNPRP